MKTSTHTRLSCIILLLFTWTSVFAQFDLGPNKLLEAASPTLSGPIHRRIKVLSPGFVARVGGVAFGAVAKPAAGFRSLGLSYRPEKNDGNRLWVTVDGREYLTPIYDWQLVPIANFADSPFKSCVTLFGELSDREEGQRLLKNHDGVLNYHPAFVDTLVGLRLFQLDILIDEPFATDLPAQNGKYLLGAGEAPPNSNANIEGWNAVVRFREGLGAELGVKTRSYVITDEGRDVYFNFDAGGLLFTGEPYIYFFLLKREFPGYDATAVAQRIVDEIPNEVRAALQGKVRTPAAVKEVLTLKVLEQLDRDDGHYDELKSDPRFSALLSTTSGITRRNHLRASTLEGLLTILATLRAQYDGNTVVPLTEYTARVSRETDMIRRINPAVWETGITVMRYAAFFRYYKATHPLQWQTFLSRLKGVSVSPPLRTPAIMKRTR